MAAASHPLQRTDLSMRSTPTKVTDRSEDNAPLLRNPVEPVPDASAQNNWKKRWKRNTLLATPIPSSRTTGPPIEPITASSRRKRKRKRSDALPQDPAETPALTTRYKKTKSLAPSLALQALPAQDLHTHDQARHRYAHRSEFKWRPNSASVEVEATPHDHSTDDQSETWSDALEAQPAGIPLTRLDAASEAEGLHVDSSAQSRSNHDIVMETQTAAGHADVTSELDHASQYDEEREIIVDSDNSGNVQVDSISDVALDKSTTCPSRAPIDTSRPAKLKRPSSSLHFDWNGLGFRSQPVPAPAKKELKGKFSSEERRTIDEVLDANLGESSRDDFVMRIQDDWSSLADFKAQLEAALPLRSMDSIRKYCKRAYHLAARGPWTEAEDNALKDAMALHPEQWTKISILVGRRAEHCYDRWRNILCIQMNDNRASGPWTVEEEHELRAIVKELQKKSQPVERVNWRAVSKKFGSRSAKACREKYDVLQTHRQQKREGGLSQTQLNREQWARSQLAAFGVGDHYDVLVEIMESFPDPAKVYQHESTLWSIVAQQNPGSRFKSSVRRASFERSKRDIGQSLMSDDDMAGLTVAQLASLFAKEMKNAHGTANFDSGCYYKGVTQRRVQAKSAKATENDEEEDHDCDDSRRVVQDASGDYDEMTAKEDDGESVAQLSSYSSNVMGAGSVPATPDSVQDRWKHSQRSL